MNKCPKCNGFGFYSITDENGRNHGVKCDHKKTKNFVLTQDLDIFSSLSRTHNDPKPSVA